jgi:hypothetical protein
VRIVVVGATGTIGDEDYEHSLRNKLMGQVNLVRVTETLQKLGMDTSIGLPAETVAVIEPRA